MTKRERFQACVNFEPVDRVLRRVEYVDEVRETYKERNGEDPVTRFDMDDGVDVTSRLVPPDDFVPPDYTGYHKDYLDNPDFWIDQFGCGQLGHGFHHFTQFISPLRNATRFEELETYPIVDKAGWSMEGVRQACEEAHAAGNYAKIWVGHMYEEAWAVRGYEAFLMDLLAERDWAEFLLDAFCRKNTVVAAGAAAAGCDLIQCGDDIANQNAMMFSADLWRETMKPRWAKVFAAVKEQNPDAVIWYHTDGNAWDVLDDLAEIGVDILNPIQPECLDPVAVRKRMGKQFAFDGCLGTQTTFPFATPDEMRKKVIDLGEALDGLHGGLMLSPSHVLEPDVPLENIDAFFEACNGKALNPR